VAQDEVPLQQQYQIQLQTGQNSFRGTGEDWNALGNAQIKQSVDSIAVSISGSGGRNAVQMHQTFRKGRYRQINANNPNSLNNVSLLNTEHQASLSCVSTEIVAVGLLSGELVCGRRGI